MSSWIDTTIEVVKEEPYDFLPWVIFPFVQEAYPSIAKALLFLPAGYFVFRVVKKETCKTKNISPEESKNYTERYKDLFDE